MNLKKLKYLKLWITERHKDINAVTYQPLSVEFKPGYQMMVTSASFFGWKKSYSKNYYAASASKYVLCLLLNKTPFNQN